MMRISEVFLGLRGLKSKHRPSQGCTAIKHLYKMSELVCCASMINMRFSFAVCKLSELASSKGISIICSVKRFDTAGLTLCYCG